MLFSDATFIGIDPTAGQKPFAYAALDGDLRLLALGEGSLEDMLAYASGQRQAVVAVCAPRQPNRGLMRRPELRQSLSPAPQPGRWLDFRLAEYLLRQHNISAPRTSSDESACPNWMQMGFSLHRRLANLGYAYFPSDGAARQVLEVYPHASFTALLHRTPFPKWTLEGRLQRQLVLYDQKLHLPDPMNFFEEITRHRLMHGILPTDELYSPAELDALVAAFTASLAACKPGEVSLLGDPDEGQVALPVPALDARYE